MYLIEALRMKINVYLLFVISSGLLLSGCQTGMPSDYSQKGANHPWNRTFENVPKFEVGESGDYQEHRLNRSYLDGSPTARTDFLDGWLAQSTPIDEVARAKLPDAVAVAYAIFEDFYEPKNLGRITNNPEWGVDQYQHVSYLVVQGALRLTVSSIIGMDSGPVEFSVKSSGTKPIVDLTINDFRPRVKGATPALYLTERYDYLINNFLGSEQLPMGSVSIMQTAIAIDESKKRLAFLNNELQIYPGHWGGWRIVTDPTVTRIDLNTSLDKAVLHFSLGYQGGRAIYQYQNGLWALIESDLTWIM